MTSNQVNYWRNEEEKRSNKEQERLKGVDQKLRQQELDQLHSREMLDLAMKNLENIGKYGRTGSLENTYYGSYGDPFGSTNSPFGTGRYDPDTDLFNMWEGAMQSIGDFLPGISIKL